MSAPVRFQRYGGTRQMCIESAEDLEHVLALDEGLWVATSAPASVFGSDAVFLSLLDADGNGRISSDELKQAIRWLLGALADRALIGREADALPLDAIRDDSPEGEAIVRSARYVLVELGCGDAGAISLDQVRSFVTGVQARSLNGDGVLVPEAAQDLELRDFIRDVHNCMGETEDRSGRAGITEAQLDAFLSAVRDHLAWRGKLTADLMPLGDDTPGALALCQEHARDVDAFFAQCRLLEFSPNAAARLKEWSQAAESVDPGDPEAIDDCLRAVPLAHPRPAGELPLDPAAVNPLCRQWVAELSERVLRPILGEAPERLTEADWERVKAVLAPYGAHVVARAGAEVEGLPGETLERYRDSDLADRARELIEADRQVAVILDGVAQVEKLLLYQRDLLRLANNFVSFPELYDPRRRALFEKGSAVIDGRWFNLALEVDDVAAHAQRAQLSNIFTIYLEVTGRTSEEKLNVAVPVTFGTKGNLSVGKRGIFFDVAGREYDARVTRVIEHPISLREALGSPFVKLWRFLAGKIEALSGSADKKLQTGLQKFKDAATQAGTTPAAANNRAGMLIGVSVAVAALSSAFAFIVKTLAGLKLYQIGLGVVGAVLAVMVPVIILALAKLRRRDLSALLEGCGWAINARMRLDRRQGKTFTAAAPYPEGARGAPRPAWVKWLVGIIVAVVLLVAAYFGANEVARRWPESQKTEQEGGAAPEEGEGAQHAQ